MNTTDRTSPAATDTHGKRPVQRLLRLLPGAASAAALIALPQLAQAAGPGEEHMYDVVAAFGLLVAAATATSIATAMSRRAPAVELAQAEQAGGAYERR